MSNKEQIEIKLSKTKLTLILISSILFVAVGFWFVINPAKFISPIVHSTTKIFIAGLAGILFFGFVGFFICKKLLDKGLGLIINDEGIIDNSSGVSAGQILWSDISGIETMKVYRENLLMLIVDNPELYINKQTNAIKRKAMQMNFRMYGSPISISVNGLQCNFQELKSILEKKLAEFKTSCLV